ncbi:MAG: DUF368 domain-containing protein [Thermoguttaceae bacterium]|nr:DUF368 domain-containing protein [Thermoguttaceae bacterium]
MGRCISSFFIFVRGILMGIADSVPGVSGGTVAMIVGIYERLVNAISSFGMEFLSLLLKRKWKDAFHHADMGFFLTLLLGIIVGLGAFSIIMTDLLQNHIPVTFGAFMGMILASVIILFRQIRKKDFASGAAMVIGAIFAWWITTMDPIDAGQDHSLLYIFMCGLVAICAMILPGISGSYILLILGEYHLIIERVKDLAHFRTTPSDLLTLCVFGAGCVIGLLSFSRVLKYLLKNHHSITLSVLTGFMAGSLNCLWPFQQQIEGEFVRFGMSEFSVQTQIYALCALLAGLVGVLVLEQIASFLANPTDKSKNSGK